MPRSCRWQKGPGCYLAGVAFLLGCFFFSKTDAALPNSTWRSKDEAKVLKSFEQKHQAQVFADDYDLFMPRSCRWQKGPGCYLAGVVQS